MEISLANWIHNGMEITELPADCVGFVYIITNRLTNRKYIGKKLAKHKKLVSQKTVTYGLGMRKTKKKYAQVDSDWITYYGSCKELTDDIESLGLNHFRREILYFCRSRAECNYLEAKEQFARRVLESDRYYNGHIQVRVHGNHINGKI
jgi:hypothetical protein